jgi:hypothetical protein
MLAEIYDWFAEGFGTADLQDARALLDELAGSHPSTMNEETAPGRIPKLGARDPGRRR